MEWEILYALCKQYVNEIFSEVTDIEFERAYIENGHLKIALSNGQVVDVGNVGTINDSATSNDYTYSSQKIENLLNNVNNTMSKKEEKIATVVLEESDSVYELTNYVRAIYGEVASLTVEIPQNVDIDYISSIIFTSGATATNLIYPDTVKMVGEGCIDGVFAPSENKRYNIIISYDGVNCVGVVGGYEV